MEENRALNDTNRDEQGRFIQGNKPKVKRRQDFNILLQQISESLTLKEQFCPLKELIQVLQSGALLPVERAQVCLRLLEYQYPRKKAIAIEIEPVELPKIMIHVCPDYDEQTKKQLARA